MLGYSYDKFLEDSSDDYPKYEDGIIDPMVIKQSDDDWVYADAYKLVENNILKTNIVLAKDNYERQKKEKEKKD